MRIAISAGHSAKCIGAVGPSPWGLDEYTENVRVMKGVAQYLRAIAGVDVETYTDTVSTDQDENLARLVSWHNDMAFNGVGSDLDISIHFNASEPTTSSPRGTEVWHMTQQPLAEAVASEIALASGLKDRGAKYSDGLYFLRNTSSPAILVEVAFCDSKPDCELYRKNFDHICEAIAAIVGDQEPDDRPQPGPPPPGPNEDHPMIEQGDDGVAVEELQQKLGVLIADGDFGSPTDTWVRAFQAACGLSVDGKVGDATWAEVDALDARVRAGELPLPKALADEIYTLAQESEIADYSWPDRGVPPQGYIAGMALCFAYAVKRWQQDDEAAGEMAHAAGNPDTDALAWYASEFSKLGMKNNTSGLDTLRHLFVMQTGLGPRESSGKYCEGRDMSASNVTSDTCEAGLFQTSWNIRSSSAAIGPLLDEFWMNPNGFLTEFKQGISPTSNNLNSYGSGDGVRYQFLSRFCPLFHVMVSAVGMRKLRQHWGPINRREVTLKNEMDELLRSVQDLVESSA